MPLEAQPLETVQTPDLDDLLRHRGDLTVKLGRQRLELHDLQDELRQIDAEILRAGGTRLEDVPINELFTRRLGNENGELTRLICDVFDGARAGLTSRDVALRLMAVLALDAGDRKALRYVVGRVCVALWVLEQKGMVRKLDTSRVPQLWQWIETA